MLVEQYGKPDFRIRKDVGNLVERMNECLKELLGLKIRKEDEQKIKEMAKKVLRKVEKILRMVVETDTREFYTNIMGEDKLIFREGLLVIRKVFGYEEGQEKYEEYTIDEIDKLDADYVMGVMIQLPSAFMDLAKMIKGTISYRKNVISYMQKLDRILSQYVR